MLTIKHNLPLQLRDMSKCDRNMSPWSVHIIIILHKYATQVTLVDLDPQTLVQPRLFVWFVFFNPWSCSDSVDLLCFSFNLIMFYFISTPGISVMINNEIFINDPNRTPSMSLGNRTGTHIDAGSYTCYVDNSLLHCTNYTRFNMEVSFFPDRKTKTTRMQMQKRNESSFGLMKWIMYIPVNI